jgi:hypothetical protein
MTTKYSFGTTTFASTTNKSKKSKHKRGSGHRHDKDGNEDQDPTDGNGSLTYSATSSVHSGGSATGESTDSSFADIMRVLDLQDDPNEVAGLKKGKGVSSAGESRGRRGHSGASVASSLNYSTDGESLLGGMNLLQTIAG